MLYKLYTNLGQFIAETVSFSFEVSVFFFSSASYSTSIPTRREKNNTIYCERACVIFSKNHQKVSLMLSLHHIYILDTLKGLLYRVNVRK